MSIRYTNVDGLLLDDKPVNPKPHFCTVVALENLNPISPTHVLGETFLGAATRVTAMVGSMGRDEVLEIDILEGSRYRLGDLVALTELVEKAGKLFDHYSKQWR